VERGARKKAPFMKKAPLLKTFCLKEAPFPKTRLSTAPLGLQRN
jgi:hypothetical protein